MTVVTVPMPDYQVRSEPDHRAIAHRVDAVIESHFSGARIGARGLRTGAGRISICRSRPQDSGGTRSDQARTGMNGYSLS